MVYNPTVNTNLQREHKWQASGNKCVHFGCIINLHVRDLLGVCCEIKFNRDCSANYLKNKQIQAVQTQTKRRKKKKEELFLSERTPAWEHSHPFASRSPWKQDPERITRGVSSKRIELGKVRFCF